MTTKTNRTFCKSEIGCHADGSFGHCHCREVLARILMECTSKMTGAVESLLLEPTDGLSEEDEAIAWLNENACRDGVWFEFENGDLLLVDLEH